MDLDAGAFERGVDDVVHAHGLAGLAVAVVRAGEVVLSRGFGTRDLRTGEPVTPDTMFHLASVSKPFVATAVVDLATAREDGRAPVLDLDAPVVGWLPELALADGRAGEVTVRHLLTHTSGIPDVVDYGWHDPQLGDDALVELVLSLSGSRLATTPGAEFSYCNAGYEVLGRLLSAVTGQTFEEAVKDLVLDPAGMTRSTFLRADVPTALAASPHVGLPLVVPGVAYPYTRRHAPSSTLHSSVAELSGWMTRTMRASTSERMWLPAVEVGDPPWEEFMALGWFVGAYRGHRAVTHQGADPGFGSMVVLLPEQQVGVVVLANSNTAPMGALVRAALDLALGVPAQPFDGGSTAAVDLDDEGFSDGVWGAIELHRTDLVWPLLDRWTALRPESSQAWAMTGWAHLVDGRAGPAGALLQRALDLDPGNDEAAALLRTVPTD